MVQPRVSAILDHAFVARLEKREASVSKRVIVLSASASLKVHYALCVTCRCLCLSLSPHEREAHSNAKQDKFSVKAKCWFRHKHPVEYAAPEARTWTPEGRKESARGNKNAPLVLTLDLYARGLSRTLRRNPSSFALSLRLAASNFSFAASRCKTESVVR